jgi:hypothetical protein
VATVHNLKKGDLRVASQVDILGTISDELHKTTGTHCCCLCPVNRKKFWPAGDIPRQIIKFTRLTATLFILYMPFFDPGISFVQIYTFDLNNPSVHPK